MKPKKYFAGGLLASIAPTVSNTLLGLLQQYQQEQLLASAIPSATPGNFNTGGKLSANSFQVKGNPNKTDGNFYPHLNAYLDHGEVVKNNAFVYSQDLKIPSTKKSFAESAAEIEKGIGKAQKTLKLNPNDPFSINTIAMSEKRMEGLAMFQELLAQKQGLRPAGVKMQTGGPIKPPPYYNPTTGEFIPYIKQGHTWVLDPAFDAYNYAHPPKATSKTFSTKPKNTNPTVTTKTPITSSLDQQIEYDRALLEEMQAAGTKDLPLLRDIKNRERNLNDIRVSSLSPTLLPNAAELQQNITSQPQSKMKSKSETYGTPFTAGDGLQALEVLSKFGQLLGGAGKMEKPYYDNTAITKTVYNPTASLYQNDRSFQNAANTIQAPSINLRRNIQNALLAQKLNADNAVLDNYDKMNAQEAKTYEQRIADQRRFNIGQANYTNDLNQRNRDAYQMAVSNAFTSLGNFGEGLNVKRQGTDAMRLLQGAYPSVYSRIIGTILNS